MEKIHTVMWLTSDQWTAWSAIGTLASALATAAAVIVTLMLARGQKPKLSVHASLVEYALDIPERRFILVKATNVGMPVVRALGVFWEVGRGREKQTFIVKNLQSFPTSAHDVMPADLAHSDQVQLSVSMPEFKDLAFQAVASARQSKVATFWFLRHLHVGVYSTVHSFTYKIEGEAMMVFLNYVEEALSLPAVPVSKKVFRTSLD